MNLLLLADMAAAGHGDALAVQADARTFTVDQLLAGAWGAADLVAGSSAVAYIGTNGLAFPIGLFAAAAAGVPFVSGCLSAGRLFSPAPDVSGHLRSLSTPAATALP